jgi:hypothetical protein
MSFRHRIALTALAASVAMPLAAHAHESDGSQECPMHAAHRGEGNGQHEGVNRRHDDATGVSHSASVHHFLLYPDGGRIVLEVKDVNDAVTSNRVREHLQRVVREFREGRFDLPVLIHDRTPPGAEAMSRLSSVIRYVYSPTTAGGQIDIVTASDEARDAIHAFLRFQIEDHRTGDSTEVIARQ